MQCELLALGPLETNSMVLWNARNEALIIDPADAEPLLAFVRAHGLTPRGVLLTHAHFDHLCGLPGVVAAWPVPVVLSPADDFIYRSPTNALPPLIPPLLGLPATVPALPATPAGLEFETLSTPGHTPGGVAYHFPAEHRAFVGDTLFLGSIGRHDFPGGDLTQLLHSIRNVLFRLEDNTEVWPGHGPPTTIGREKRHNPFVGG